MPIGSDVWVATILDDDLIEELLAIRWWDWPTEKVAANKDLLWSPRIREFIERHQAASAPPHI